MKKHEGRITAVCPLCGRTYHERPALSREDNATPICPDCGTRQALEGMGVGRAEQDEILGIIHRSVSGEGGSRDGEQKTGEC